jgi:hypothetical protein
MHHRAMKLALVLTAAGLASLSAPRDAHAIAACYTNQGFAPSEDTALPPHARVVYYTDSNSTRRAPTATLGGKPVELKISILKSAPYTFTVMEVDSDKTGKLVITFPEGATATYTIAKEAELPKEIPVITGRFVRHMHHTTVKENFDGLAVRLPAGTPAIMAHVKLRRDDKAPWSEYDVPVAPHDFQDKRPVIRMGELGCTQNYTVALLENGVDIEATITLVDGTTRPAKDLAAHVTLPKQP